MQCYQLPTFRDKPIMMLILLSLFLLFQSLLVVEIEDYHPHHCWTHKLTWIRTLTWLLPSLSSPTVLDIMMVCLFNPCWIMVVATAIFQRYIDHHSIEVKPLASRSGNTYERLSECSCLGAGTLPALLTSTVTTAVCHATVVWSCWWYSTSNPGLITSN